MSTKKTGTLVNGKYLTKANRRVYSGVYMFIIDNQMFPTFRQLSRFLGGLSLSTVFWHVSRLRRAGLIEDDPGLPGIRPKGASIALPKPALPLEWVYTS